MYGLGQCHQNGRDTELAVNEVFDNIGVESEDAEFVRAHDAGEELHE